ncbi:hypothetical protein ABFA07_008059 [Porites harrisoni]
MKTLTVVLVILVFAVLLLHDVRGGHDSEKCSANSGLKFKICKTMPIEPVKFCTPVIKSQRIRGSQITKLFTRVASGYLVMRYALNKAPVYREGFPVYEKYVSIPEERAVRISSERVSLLDANGNLCLGYSSIPRTLKEGLEKNLVELKTTVIYKTNPENVYITILYGVNNTISLKDIKEKNFTVTILARYNVTVLRDTDCTQVEKQINGTMIEMYETNPYFIRDLIFLIIFSVVFLVVGPVCAFLNRNR